jgi:hypothetical protein
MRTALSTAILAILLLNAGAFASDNRAYLRGRIDASNVTVLTKNQAWPIKSRITLEPCAEGSCTGV